MLSLGASDVIVTVLVVFIGSRVFNYFSYAKVCLYTNYVLSQIP